MIHLMWTVSGGQSSSSYWELYKFMFHEGSS